MLNFDAMAGELLRAIRGEMSQACLNRRLEARSNQVRRWENGERRISWSDFVKVCEICGVDLLIALRSMHPHGTPLEDGKALAKRVIGAAPLVDVAKRSGISRFTLMRWVKGEGCPTLGDILNLVHHCQFTLFEMLRNLVNVDDLPSARQMFQERQARKQVYYERPDVAAILCALKLDTYQDSPQHEPGFIAEKAGISLEEEQSGLKLLSEVGKIHWDGTHFVAIDEHLELTDSREFNAFCRYWFQRALNFLDELPNPHPVIGYGMDIQPASAATLQRVRDEYKQFYRRVRTLIKEDKGSKDQVMVFNALFFDLEKRFQESDSPHLWVPVDQPTNGRETGRDTSPAKS